MTEQQWLKENRPRVMIDFLRGNQRVRNDRKLRLFACACARATSHLLRNERCVRAIEIGERFADGEATDEQRKQAALTARVTRDYRGSGMIAGYRASLTVAAYAGYSSFYAANAGEDPEQCEWLRDLYGNPFHSARLDPAWLAWNDGTVVKLAQSIYENRAFDGLPVLADALSEAGCDDTELLLHCRQPMGHVRGCWVCDLLSGKMWATTGDTTRCGRT